MIRIDLDAAGFYRSCGFIGDELSASLALSDSLDCILWKATVVVDKQH